MTATTERAFKERKQQWLKDQGSDVLECTALNEQLRDAIRLSSDDISDALVVAVQVRIWEKGIGHFSDSPDRCKVHRATTMQEWVEADWGLGMTMSQLFRTVANKRMNASAVEATTLLIEATPKEVLETVAETAPEGDLLSKPVPGWRQIIRANEDAYGPEWRKAAAALDDLLHRENGGDRKSDEFRSGATTSDPVPLPDRKSREGRRRTLKRYADSADLCADKGVDQGEVKQALRAFEEGELSATAAMRACGLLPKSDSSTNRVFLVRDSKEVARRLLDAAGPDRAAEIVAALTELLLETK